MATYYVNFTTGNDTTGDGSSGTPWKTMQKAVNSVGNNDVVYLTGGPETLTTAVTLNGLTGNQFIGTDASWNPGTQYVLDGDSTATNCIYGQTTNSTLLTFKYITITGCTGDGLAADATRLKNVYFEDCVFDSCGGAGVSLGRPYQYAAWLRCSFSNNGGNGFNRPNTDLFLCCVFCDNTGRGSYDAYGWELYLGCIFDGNGQEGNKQAIGGMWTVNCVFYANDDAGLDWWSSSVAFVAAVGCRFEAHSSAGEYGIEGTTTIAEVFYCYFYNNNTDISLGNNRYGNLLAQASSGMNNPASDDFNLTAGALLRDEAITLPVW